MITNARCASFKIILGVDLLGKLLTFDPKDRFSVDEALAHPWLVSFHSLNDCPDGPPKFGKWQFVEELETTEEFRKALYQEVVNFRQEVRSLALEFAAESSDLEDAGASMQPARNGSSSAGMPERVPFPRSEAETADEDATDVPHAIPPRASISRYATDPYRAYSISKRTSVFSLHERTASGPPTGDVNEGSLDRSYPFPSRSRIQSSDAIGGVSAPPPARLIRHLSTVSITGLTDATKANGMAVDGGVVLDSIARAADAPASELPSEWARENSAKSSA
jgi:serine/threonine protein kinase